MPTHKWRLVDRCAEIAAVTQALDRLESPIDGAVLQVAGEPGIGKSAVLRELIAAAGGRGHTVLVGRAAEFEAEMPFGVLNDAMEDWLLRQDVDRLRSLAGDLAEDLARVLPAFERVATREAPRLIEERYRVYRAVRGLLTTLATETPVVLVLDDVHWADPGSVELLAHLLAHPCRGRVLLALGYRPAQVSPLLARAMERAVHEGHGARLDLRPLTEGGARELVGSTVNAPTFHRCYRDSGGNPFFLLELARAVTLGLRPTGAHGCTTSSVPPSVRMALGSEISALSVEGRLLLEGAAVTGDPFRLSLAAAAADISEGKARRLIDELQRRQLVLPTASPREFTFRHPIVRATVSELVSSQRRAEAHGRLASALAARGASASVQAPHLEQSASRGDEAAIAVLAAAGQADAPRSPALAARWFQAALDLLPEGPALDARRVELLVALATALGAAGKLDDSRGVLVALLSRLPRGHSSLIPLVAFCAGVEHLLGRHCQADERLANALSQLPDQRSLEAVQLKIEQAAGHGYQNRAQDMLRAAEEALDGATSLGQRALSVVALGQVALARYFLKLPAGEAIDRAGAALDALDDAALATRLDIGLWVGWSEAVLERHERSIQHCVRVIDVSHATGQGAYLLVTRTAQAWSLIRLGRLAEAEGVLSAVTEAGRLAPNLFLSVAVGLSAMVATAKGDYGPALSAGQESVRLALRADPGLIPGMSGLYHAIPLIETGQPERARAVLMAMSGGDPDLRTSRSGWAQAFEILTRAELALGALDAAEEWARRAEASAAGGDLAAELAIAARASAAVALARGRPRQAAERALEAARRAEDAGAALEASRCRMLAGQALAHAHHRVPATMELQRAARDLGRLGAAGYRAQAESELHRLTAEAPAVRVPPDTPSGWNSLTPSERAVVELVAEGLTNPEVAKRLFLSPHTVKRHLANAMQKVGLNSRVKLAREAAEHRNSASPS